MKTGQARGLFAGAATLAGVYLFRGYFSPHSHEWGCSAKHSQPRPAQPRPVRAGSEMVVYTNLENGLRAASGFVHFRVREALLFRDLQGGTDLNQRALPDAGT
jgi:hypothetical protein